MEKMKLGFLIVSFILQILALLMLSLNTNYMISRFGETVYPKFHVNEKIFLGIGITCLSISLISCGLNIYYLQKSDSTNITMANQTLIPNMETNPNIS